MARHSNKRISTRPRKSRGRQRYADKGPDSAGDIPKEPKRSYTTVSCQRPRLTTTFTCRQLVEGADIIATSVSSLNTTYSFSLSLTDQASTFAGLFDQYRIDCVCFHIVPANTAIQVSTASTPMTQLYCVLDFDDSTALSSSSAARQYDNCIVLEPGESLKRQFAPRIAMAAYNGAFSGYANMEAEWIDLGSTDVVHYGVKIWVPALSSNTLQQQWKVYTEYFLSFKAVR